MYLHSHIISPYRVLHRQWRSLPFKSFDYAQEIHRDAACNPALLIVILSN